VKKARASDTPSRSIAGSRKRRRKKAVRRATGGARKWSRAVSERSNALDLEESVFKRTPKQIALSLKRSAERSGRRKSAPFRSAMSMLSFYENRAGRNLPASRRRAIARAKDELRKLYAR